MYDSWILAIVWWRICIIVEVLPLFPRTIENSCHRNSSPILDLVNYLCYIDLGDTRVESRFFTFSRLIYIKIDGINFGTIECIFRVFGN